jgi:hypothetical protein
MALEAINPEQPINSSVLQVQRFLSSDPADDISFITAAIRIAALPGYSDLLVHREAGLKAVLTVRIRGSMNKGMSRVR